MSTTPLQGSKEFNTLLFRALDYGVENVRDSGGPLIPFVMYQDQEGIRLERQVTATLEEGTERCRSTVCNLPQSVTRYVIVYDGYITIPGQGRCDAIIAEGGERGASRSLRLAQCYRPRKSIFSKFTIIGNPAMLGDAENLLKR